MSSFAVVGLGFISDRHIQAIKNLGHELTAVCEVDFEKMYKSNGAKFFYNWMDLKDSKLFKTLDYVAICTPNDHHYYMIKDCLDAGVKVICEKPPLFRKDEYDDLMKHPNIDKLSIVFQCRLATGLDEIVVKDKNKVKIQIEVYRDDWYMNSWKAITEQSGGLVFNIGCHYMDLLIMLFGEMVSVGTSEIGERRCSGSFELDKATVEWTVAIDATIDKQKRIFEINGKNYNLTQMGFEGLHTKVYEEVIAGRGYKLKQYKPTLELINKIYD